MRKEDSDWLIGVIKKYENLQAEENTSEAGAAQSESIEIEKRSLVVMRRALTKSLNLLR